jgi:hypothetical protein
MRLRLASLLPALLLVACGGSTGGRVEDGDRTPATPLPGEQIAASRGPTGFVTMLSVDGTVVALPSVLEDPSRSGEAGAPSATPCAVTRAAGSRPREVSAGTLTVTLPTRTGPEELELRFDPKAGEYEPATFEALVEPGGIMRVSAKGDVAPAFDAELTTAANVAFEVPEEIEVDAEAPKDVTTRWTAEGDNDEVFIDLGIGDMSVTCWFDSKAGSGTVPAALIAELLADGRSCESSTCLMFLASKHNQSVMVGEWTMVLAHGFATIRKVRVTR